MNWSFQARKISDVINLGEKDKTCQNRWKLGEILTNILLESCINFALAYKKFDLPIPQNLVQEVFIVPEIGAEMGGSMLELTPAPAGVGRDG